MEQVTADNCSREHIHIPGLIQPHGALMVLNPHTYLIEQASLNAETFLDRKAQDLIGNSIFSALEIQKASSFESKVKNIGLINENPIKIMVASKGQGVTFDVIGHINRNLKLILEFEKSENEGDISFSNVYRKINNAIRKIEESNSRGDLFQNTLDQMKALSGFDRIMIYQFDQEWNGKVLAEVKEPEQEPFLGLQYPASDIPVQARALYTLNWLRLIPNVDYHPVGLWPGDSVPAIDMSSSVLRSVSPIHLQYLKNMGVGASMSVSIINEGKLWGLIAFHHRQSKYLNYEIRQGLEFIGKFFSLQIVAKNQFENLDYKKNLKKLQPVFLQKMRGASQFLDGLSRGTPNLLSFAAGSTGACLRHRKTLTTVGVIPCQDELEKLFDWLKKEKSGVALFSTNHLSEFYPDSFSFKDVASGILAITIPEPDPSFIVWFKPEVIQTVNWAGAPEKEMSLTSMGPVLSPRRSFALWKEELRARSLPWAPEEIEAITELRRSIIEVDLERQVSSAMRSNEELDQFAYIIAHDLKEPLRGILGFSEFLADDLKGKLDPESEINLKDISLLAKKSQNLITELFEYSKLGRAKLAYTQVDLNEVVEETLLLLKEVIHTTHTHVSIPQKLPVAYCDKIRIGEVFHNLLTNATKYSDRKQKHIEIGFEDAFKRYYVKDDGIGVALENRERIFNMFERLHDRDDYGGGTGVGLALVKQIVERHSGKVWLESEVGKGSTFYFTLSPEGYMR